MFTGVLIRLLNQQDVHRGTGGPWPTAKRWENSKVAEAQSMILKVLVRGGRGHRDAQNHPSWPATICTFAGFGGARRKNTQIEKKSATAPLSTFKCPQKRPVASCERRVAVMAAGAKAEVTRLFFPLHKWDQLEELHRTVCSLTPPCFFHKECFVEPEVNLRQSKRQAVLLRRGWNNASKLCYFPQAMVHGTSDAEHEANQGTPSETSDQVNMPDNVSEYFGAHVASFFHLYNAFTRPLLLLLCFHWPNHCINTGTLTFILSKLEGGFYFLALSAWSSPSSAHTFPTMRCGAYDEDWRWVDLVTPERSDAFISFRVLRFASLALPGGRVVGELLWSFHVFVDDSISRQHETSIECEASEVGNGQNGEEKNSSCLAMPIAYCIANQPIASFVSFWSRPPFWFVRCCLVAWPPRPERAFRHLLMSLSDIFLFGIFLLLAQFLRQKDPSRITWQDELRGSCSESLRNVLHWSLVLLFLTEAVMFSREIALWRRELLSNPDEISWGMKNSDAGKYLKYLVTANIKIVEAVWTPLSIYLTKRENHRTDMDLKSSMIVKLFAVKFVIFYYPFIRTIFIQPHVEGCPGEDNPLSGKRDSIFKCFRCLSSSIYANIFVETLQGAWMPCEGICSSSSSLRLEGWCPESVARSSSLERSGNNWSIVFLGDRSLPPADYVNCKFSGSWNDSKYEGSSAAVFSCQLRAWIRFVLLNKLCFLEKKSPIHVFCDWKANDSGEAAHNNNHQR